MRVFVSHRVIVRRQARLMVRFFLLMGALALAAALVVAARHWWSP